MHSIIKKTFVSTLLVSVLFSTTPITPKASAEIIVTNVITNFFQYDLQVGSEGQDVYNLQRFLNADEKTAIAFSGTGSRGQESTYFGELTKAAVIKFQKKYLITPADGYVGLSTRTKINELYPNTNFNIPYTPKTIVITKKDTSADTGINLCQFIDLLIAIDAIKPEKASQARGLVSGCSGSNPNIATNNTATSSYWTNLPKTINTTTSTTDALASYYDSLSNLSLYADNSTTTFTGNKSLGDIRSYAVFAGGSLTNTNNADFYVAPAVISTTSPRGVVSTTTAPDTNRTLIIGDVSALTEQAVPLKVTGKNEYNLGSRTQQLSSLNKAIDLSNKLPCDYSFSASSTDIGGRTLGPGTYCFTGDIDISNPIVLSNPASTTNPTATTTGLYVFRATGNLNVKNLYPATFTGTNKQEIVQLAKPNIGFDDKTGLPPYAIFWITEGNANIANNTIFLGTIMTKTGYINLGENTDIPEGRVQTRTDITLNKNLIKTPPDPIKVTVNLDGDSSGSVSGPGGFFCSTEKGKKNSASGTSTLNKKGVTCQFYYPAGEVITLKASPVSSEDPSWRGGCENGKNGVVSGNSCVITMKNDKQLAVEFSLDTFGGSSIPYPPFFLMKLPCITTPGFLFAVVGTKPGVFVVPLNKTIDGIEGWVPFMPVIGTLQDNKSTSCILPTGKGAGPFRVVEDMEIGLGGLGL